MVRSSTGRLIAVMALRQCCSLPNKIQLTLVQADLFHLNRPLWQALLGRGRRVFEL